MVDRRVQLVAFALAVLDLTELGDVLHWAGPVQRHKRDDILDAVGFHAPQRVHHAARFHLKHGNSARVGIQLVAGFIIQGDRVDVALSAGRGHV